MSAMASDRTRGVGPMPAQLLLPGLDLTRALPRANWRIAWRLVRLHAPHGLLTPERLSAAPESYFLAYLCLRDRLSGPRRAQRGAGLVSFINNIRKG